MQLMLCTRRDNIIQHLQQLPEDYTYPPSPKVVREFEETDNLIMADRRKANIRFWRLNTTDVHSSQIVNMDQLRLRLAVKLIKRRHPNNIIKIKT